MADALQKMRDLIAETERWLAFHYARRERPFEKESAQIEILACHIRVKALRQCVRIMEGAMK